MKIFVTLFVVSLLGICACDTYEMPESCMGQRFCTEKGTDYPDEEDILEVLLDSDWKVNIVGDELSDRNGYDDFSCGGKYQNATVYYILDNNNKTQVVAQAENYIIQKYEIGICHPDSNCNEQIMRTLRAGPLCEDTYMEFDFIIINSDFKLELIQAELPVCCKCRPSPNNKYIPRHFGDLAIY